LRLPRSSKLVFVRVPADHFRQSRHDWPSSAADRICALEPATRVACRGSGGIRRTWPMPAFMLIWAISSRASRKQCPESNSCAMAQALWCQGALTFVVYAVAFFFRAFATSGFELGVETLNGVTPQQLDGLNPAVMGYITHLRGDSRLHRCHRDRRWRLSVVRGSRGLVVGVDNCRDRARRGFWP